MQQRLLATRRTHITKTHTHTQRIGRAHSSAIIPMENHKTKHKAAATAAKMIALHTAPTQSFSGMKAKKKITEFLLLLCRLMRILLLCRQYKPGNWSDHRDYKPNKKTIQTQSTRIACFTNLACMRFAVCHWVRFVCQCVINNKAEWSAINPLRWKCTHKTDSCGRRAARYSALLTHTHNSTSCKQLITSSLNFFACDYKNPLVWFCTNEMCTRRQWNDNNNNNEKKSSVETT